MKLEEEFTKREFEALMDAAEKRVIYYMITVGSLRDSYKKFGLDIYLSSSELKVIKELAGEYSD